jgi:hypothetical protein
MVGKAKGQGLLARVTDPDENSGRLPTGGKAWMAHRPPLATTVTTCARTELGLAAHRSRDTGTVLKHLMYQAQRRRAHRGACPTLGAIAG